MVKEKYMDCVEKIRIKAVLPFIKGNLLDIGCGYNNLVHCYGKGIGVDVFDWEGRPDFLIKRSDNLPFDNFSFDTITFLACLNHIPYRLSTLQEARRLLKSDGRIIITMIGRLAGRLIHGIGRKDELIRRFQKGETMGLNEEELNKFFKNTNLVLIKKKYIPFTLSKIYILQKKSYI